MTTVSRKIIKSGPNFYTAHIFDGCLVSRIIEARGYPPEDPQKWTLKILESRRRSQRDEFGESKETFCVKGLRTFDKNGGDMSDVQLMLGMFELIARGRSNSGTHVLVHEPELAHLRKFASSHHASAALQQALGDFQSAGADGAEFIQALQDGEIDALLVLSRLARYRQHAAALARFRELVDAPATPESVFQEHLEKNVWMFGTGNSQLVDKRTVIAHKQQDFIVRNTADGFHDIIEIKTTLHGKSPLSGDPASGLHPSGSLSKAITQVADYIQEVEHQRHTILANDNIEFLRPRGYVIIGRDESPKHAAALRSINSYLHRIEVMTYDQLIRIAERALEY